MDKSRFPLMFVIYSSPLVSLGSSFSNLDFKINISFQSAYLIYYQILQAFIFSKTKIDTAYNSTYIPFIYCVI